MLSRRITCYVKALAENFDISLLCIKDAEQPHIERYEKARLLRVPLKQGTLQQRMEQFERAIRRQLESEEYIVAHSFDFVSGRILAELKKQLGYHLVFEAITLCSQEWPHSQHELTLPAETLENIKAEENYVATQADALIVASQQQKKYFENLGLHHHLLHVLPHPSLPRKGLSPQPTACFQFLNLGGESQLKALQTTLNALDSLPQESKIQLALGGHYGAKSKTYLATCRETLHSKENVIWPDLRHEIEINTLCSQANAALLALEHESRNVSFGGSMPELADFFAWGLPIIAADLPCVREFLGPDEALFFAPGDSTTLAACMQELAASPSLQAHLSSASASKAAAFLPAWFMHETLCLYKQWVDKQSQQSEQFLEPLPDITPSMARTTSTTSSLPSSPEQDTIIVPPASTPPPPK